LIEAERKKVDEAAEKRELSLMAKEDKLSQKLRRLGSSTQRFKRSRRQKSGGSSRIATPQDLSIDAATTIISSS
jgi:hypothetical protein